MLSGLASTPATVPAAQDVAPTPQFRRYGIAEGLPSSSIDGLAQDAEGYIWIATGSGLARYDGTTFEIWRHNPDDPRSISSGRVPSLLVDHAGRLWAAGMDGLNRYDPAQQVFLHWRHDDRVSDSVASNDLSALAQDSMGHLWVGNYTAGLDLLHADGKGFDHLRHDQGDPNSLVSDHIRTLLDGPDGSMWIGTDRGLDRRLADGKLSHVRFVPPAGSAYDKPFSVHSLSYAGKTLIVGTQFGPYYIDSEQTAQRLAPGQIPDEFTLASALDAQGRLWVGTNANLYLRDQAHAFHRFGASPLLPYALPNRVVRRLLLDHEGGLWIATENGLAYLGPDWNEFTRTIARPYDASSLNDEPVSAVAAAGNGQLWVGHEKGAIDRLDPVTQRIEHIPFAPPGTRHTVQGMLEDHRGRLWVNTPDGTVLLDHGALKTVSPAFWANRLALDEQGYVYADLDDGSGVARIDPDTLQATQLVPADLPVKRNLQTVQDMHWFDHALWVAGSGGLLRWTPAQSPVQFVPGVEHSFIHAFDMNGERLWVLGEKNLDVYHWNGERADRIASYPLGLRRALDDALGLRVDRLGRAWMFTRSGLWCYDPANDSLRSFGLQSGLVDLHFTSDTPARLPDGRLYAPTMDSVVSFLPEAIHAHVRKPTLVLHSLSVQRGGRKQALPPESRSLSLRWNDRDFSVGVRALTYIAPGQTVYRFLMDGIDSNWIDNGERGERSFPQLAGGDYRLRVQAAGPDGIWNELAIPLQIHVESPPWLRWWAWIIYALLLAATMLGLVWLTRRRQRGLHHMELLAQEHRLAHEANSAKTRFLAELGHEIRTPMTGVLGMAELLLNQPLPLLERSYAQTIKNSGEVLLTLVNDALDLARIEAGRLELVSAPFDPRALLQDVVALGLERASAKGLALTVTVAPDVPARVIGDAVRIKQIIMNLTHNALKFTDHGSVRLTLQTVKDCLLFEVRDTGSGISSNDQLRLFHHFQQLDGPQRNSGSGLGLAICRKLTDLMGGQITLDSETGRGSVFHLSLPLHAAHSDLTELPARASRPGLCRQLLLVEDDSVVAAAVTGLLQIQGHIVTHVSNGLQGLQMLDQHRFDAVFVDLDLPGLDGHQWAQLVRAREPHGERLPMIAITARSGGDEEALARSAGMDGFLRKPLTGEQLGDALAAQLKRYDPPQSIRGTH
ncbi:response regulator [Dyella tabacisoli]|uniref:histidine kinase n=2 Tax=Dyella tabacisoli TaxID=2282381 RepID=A0A369UN97_9GAMM|nr:response regulator [Dyella tabacisoli]